MSFKAKNLSYEANEPAFLRRLRGEVAGEDPSRHTHSVARPRKPKQADEDDGPTYVVEESNDTLSKEEYEALLSEKAGPSESKDGDDVPSQESKGASAVPATEPETAVDGESEGVRVKQRVAEAGMGQQKRKAGKVVGDDVEEKEEDGGDKAVTKANVKKPKRKGKAIKLSFGDDEAT